MKLYSIEITGEKYKSYRFVSLYNGTRGTFYFDKDEAIMQGEDHQKIICAILPELKGLVDEDNNVKDSDINLSDVYAVKDIEMFAHILMKREDEKGTQGYIVLYSPYKTIVPEGLEKAKLEFKNIDTIYELIKYRFWIKCTEELKTI